MERLEYVQSITGLSSQVIINNKCPKDYGIGGQEMCASENMQLDQTVVDCDACWEIEVTPADKFNIHWGWSKNARAQA